MASAIAMARCRQQRTLTKSSVSVRGLGRARSRKAMKRGVVESIRSELLVDRRLSSTPAAPGEVGVFAGSGLFWRGTGVVVAIVTIDGCGRRVGRW